jgi:hypothetical protein
MTTDPELSTASLFELVWGTLVDVLGTATTASLFRRATRNVRGMPEAEELGDFEIVRDGMQFGYALPEAWKREGAERVEALRFLVREGLCPLLTELTGAVVIGLLERVPELREHDIIST